MSHLRPAVICPVLGLILLVLSGSTTRAQQEEPEELVVGPNVNMVSGTEFPGGDPFLQRQNEPSGAVSSRNDLHLLAGANDYRAVDIPFAVSGPAEAESGGDSWLGVFTSTDGGSRWSSTLLPGYPQDVSCGAETPPALCGYQAGADPVVRAGTHGLFYYSGIVFNRGEGARSAVFVSRFIDLNNDEGGQPIRHMDSVIVQSDEGTQFLDKPWIAVDVPRAGAATTTFQVPQEGGTVPQTVTCGRVYLAYSAITGSPSGGDLRSEILFRSSDDCGTTWSDAVTLTSPDTLNQGASVAVTPTTGDVVVAWRQFHSIQSFLGEGTACAQPAGYWKTAPWPVATLTLGGVVYTKAQALNLLKSNANGGDATQILVHQLIPAKLNVLTGIDDGLQSLIEQADVWLVAHPLGTDPQGVPRDEGLSIKSGLQVFNDGGDPALCGTTTTVVVDDAIVAVKSADGGQSFSEPAIVSNAIPFDQGSTDFSFRSTAYPSVAVDAEPTPRTYVVWSQRGLALPGSDPEGDESRIAMSTSLDGMTWTAPVAVDLPDAPGHQITPSLLSTGGKLVLAYYDFRQDVSGIFEPFVADLPVGDRLRHSVDVRVAISEPGASPEFTNYSVIAPSTEPQKPSQQASRYPFVIVGTSESDAETIQLQYMTPNLPLFAGGTTPFIGDSIDVLGQLFTRDSDGTWRFASGPGEGGVYHALWTDNRDVVPPEDGDWTSYVAPLLAGQTGPRPSVFDPAVTVPDCNTVTLGAERTGMRNQNIYTAVLTRGLVVAAPGNTKVLGYSDNEELVQATFVVLVQNVTDQNRRFRLTAVQPADGDASFQQLMLQTQIDVTVPAYSSVSRTVYVRSPDPTATALVLVSEIDTAGNPIVGGLTGSVRLNPDPTGPAPDLSEGEVHTPAILNPAIFNPAILNPAIFNPAILNPAILNPAIFNPAIFNPAILNPAIFNPAIFNPAILNPAIFNPAIFNPAILNPAILNPAILNPAILNPAILNPAIFNPAILNPAILNPAILNTALDETSQARDYTFAVTNDGTTTTAYDLNLNVGAQPDGLIYQLLVFKLNATPVADGCNVVEEAQQELMVNLLAPQVHASRLLDSASADPSAATFSVEPGGTVWITLRVLPNLEASTPGDPLEFDVDNVSVAVVSQPLDTADLAAGDIQPKFDSNVASSIDPLVISPEVLPSGQVGVTYPTQVLTASGGSGTRVWSVVGTLPPGLALSATGILSGTPVSTGNFPFVVRVIDAVQLAEQTFTIDVVAPSTPVGSLAFLVQPTNSTGAQAMSTVAVEALDVGGIPLPGITVGITIGTAACGSASLSGTVFAVTDLAGVASFSTLSINRGGYGYMLRATAVGSPAATTLSVPFDVEGFCATASSGIEHYIHTATLLPNGLTLVAGGLAAGGAPTAVAELYNFETGSFVTTGSMGTQREFHSATLLPDGEVLIAGGIVFTLPALNTAETYDPVSGTFTPTGPMSAGRINHRATLLPNGKVLITGGSDSPQVAELYDPATRSFSLTGVMLEPRADHTATLLPNGKVLITGSSLGGVLASAELYDPATGTFSSTGSMSAKRQDHEATLLSNGKVLMTGGWNGSATEASAEIYDPVLGTFGPAGSMNSARRLHTATALPNGKVLIASGASVGLVATTELYDPVTATFSLTGGLIIPRLYHTSTLLPDGRVLVAGGGSGTFLSSAELFYPTDPPFAVAGFESTGSMGTARSGGHSATLLPNGMALVAGGYASSGLAIASAELFDPGTGTFVPTGSLGTARVYSTATLLPNGEVLIAGGSASTSSAFFNTAETYDPVSGAFSATGTMTVARGAHTATLLPIGKVLIVGGTGGLGSNTSAELYDPQTRTFSPTGGLIQGYVYHAATLLPNGKVLIVGNGGPDAELYDPDTGTFSSTGSMLQAREQLVATLLSNGKVLVTGGEHFDSGSYVFPLTAEVYDPAMGTFSPVGDMNSIHIHHTATPLPNGKVLITGGNAPTTLSTISELYDPVSATFSLAGGLLRPRTTHVATMLPNGKVLFAGGGVGTTTPTTAELYRPGH